MPPGDRHPLFVQRRGQPVVGGGAVVVVPDVVFAGPHDLDRCASGARGLDGIDHEILLAAPKECDLEGFGFPEL